MCSLQRVCKHIYSMTLTHPHSMLITIPKSQDAHEKEIIHQITLITNYIITNKRNLKILYQTRSFHDPSSFPLTLFRYIVPISFTIYPATCSLYRPATMDSWIVKSIQSTSHLSRRLLQPRMDSFVTGSTSAISSSVIFTKNMASLERVFDADAIAVCVIVLPFSSRR